MNPQKKEWWEDFFSGLALDLWRQAVTEDQTRAEADFVEKLLQVPPKARLLDAPCGNGRHSLELASRGYRMTGVDIAGDFLEEAKHKADERQLQVDWVKRDMRNLPWKEAFDGAFCLGNGFGYFSDAGNASFLKSVASALKPGARFALDASSVPEIVLPRFRDREWVRIGDILFLEENRYDHVNGRLETEYTFVRDGKTERKTGSHRIYTYRELWELLGEAGFQRGEAFGSVSGEPFHLGSQSLFLVATRA